MLSGYSEDQLSMLPQYEGDLEPIDANLTVSGSPVERREGGAGAVPQAEGTTATN